MSNKFKVGDSVVVKSSAMSTDAATDCTQGKTYVVTASGNSLVPVFANPSAVCFIDDVGDSVCFYDKELDLA